MTRILSITADDLGMDPGIDAGIATAVAAGGVRNVAVWADADPSAFPPDLRDLPARACVGFHLGLLPPEWDIGRPGDWSQFWPFLWPTREMRAAVAGRLDGALRRWERCGWRPWFLNGHQHLHLLPGWVGFLGAWATRQGCARFRHPVWRGTFRAGRPLAMAVVAALGILGRCRGSRAGVQWLPAVCRHGDRFTLEEIVSGLQGFPDGVWEMVTHPGRPGEEYLRRTGVTIDCTGQERQLCRPDRTKVLNASGWSEGRLDGKGREGPP